MLVASEHLRGTAIRKQCTKDQSLQSVNQLPFHRPDTARKNAHFFLEQLNQKQLLFLLNVYRKLTNQVTARKFPLQKRESLSVKGKGWVEDIKPYMFTRGCMLSIHHSDSVTYTLYCYHFFLCQLRSKGSIRLYKQISNRHQ